MNCKITHFYMKIPKIQILDQPLSQGLAGGKKRDPENEVGILDFSYFLP